MENHNDPLDKLIAETLNKVHDHAFQEGLSKSHPTLDLSKNRIKQSPVVIKRKRISTNALLAVAASVILIASLAIPVLNSSDNSQNNERIRTANSVGNKVPTTSSKIENGSTTTSTSIVDTENTTTTTNKQGTQNQTTTPSTTPSFSTTQPAVVNQLARISYSNTRANDIPLDGATISGNVYIFVKDPEINSVHWWLDQPGVWDKALATRAGSKSPQDFNYRVQPEAVIPNPYDTSQLSVGEHTMGIQTRNISGQYAKVTIKFYVTR